MTVRPEQELVTRAEEPEPEAGEDGERQAARHRVTARRDFLSHLVAYVVVNGFIVGTWALTGGGYFWPAWVLGGWGCGLVLHFWDVFVRRPVTAADVEAELRRGRRRGAGRSS